MVDRGCFALRNVIIMMYKGIELNSTKNMVPQAKCLAKITKKDDVLKKEEIKMTDDFGASCLTR